MAPSANTDKIRASWQPRQAGGAPARAWLIVRRLVASLVAITLIAACAWLLMRMLSHTDTYLAYWTATTYEPKTGEPLEFSYHDLQAIESATLTFDQENVDIIDPIKQSLTRAFLEEHLAKLHSGALDGKESLVLCITAHGFVDNGKAFLHCEWGDGNRQPTGEIQSYPISSLLEHLKNVPCKTKLLVLDAGRSAPDVPVEPTTNCFENLLEKAVRDTNDPSLWVLTANSPQERSHVSPSESRSVFGSMVSQGLTVDADANGDRQIDLDEFVQSVQGNVSKRVELVTEGNATQTPQLLHADASKLAPDILNNHVLTSALPSSNANSKRIDNNPLASAAKEAADEAVAKQVTVTEDSVAPVIDQASKLTGRESEEEEASGPGASNVTDEARAQNVRENADRAVGNDHKLRAKWRLEEVSKLLDRANSLPNEQHPRFSEPRQWNELVDTYLWCEKFNDVGIPVNEARKWAVAINELDNIKNTLSSLENNSPAVELTAAIPLKEFPSLAMAELVAKHSPSNPQAREIAKFAQDYDRWLGDVNSNSIATLDALLTENKDKTKDLVRVEIRWPFYELQLLNAFREPDSEVPWVLQRLLLKTRRLAEQSSADLLCGEGWAHDKLIVADHLRLEGEREALDRINDDWTQSSQAKLKEATTLYQQARADLNTVREIKQRRNDALRHAPERVQWARLNRNNKETHRDNVIAIRDLFTIVDSVHATLAEPSSKNLEELKRLNLKLQEAKQSVDDRVNDGHTAWSISSLLRTRLPPLNDRKKLQAKLSEAEAKMTVSDDFKPKSALMSSSPTKTSDQSFASLADEEELESQLRKICGSDQDFDFNDTIDSWTSQKDYSARRAQLIQLRQALGDWLLQRQPFADRIEQNHNLTNVLNAATWHDLMAWQHDRVQREQIDAPQLEQPYLESASAAYVQAANAVPNQPGLGSAVSPPVAIEAPSEVALVQSMSEELSFSAKSLLDATQPIWIVCQYNPGWIELSGPGILHQHEIPSEILNADTSRRVPNYAARLTESGIDATVDLAAAGSSDFRLRITRRENKNAGGATRLILKAISSDGIVRRELNVTLPGRELLELTVDADREYWAKTPSGDGVVLYPLPNHDMPFAFQVINRAKVSKTLDVQFLIPDPESLPEGSMSLPLGAQSEDMAKEVLKPFRPRKLGAKQFKVQLKESVEPARITTSPDDKVDPEANFLIPENSDAAKFKPLILKHGLLVLLRDTTNKEVTIRRIQIVPQRPANYVNVSASYDAANEQIRITAEARTPHALPDEGIKLKADVTDMSAEQPKQLTATLQKSNTDPVTLHAHVATTATQDLRASIDVDSYPRAFVFRVQRGVPNERLPLFTGPEVRIVSPLPNTPYGPSKTEVPVGLQVDVAPRMFDDDSNTASVEFGIDQNKDRYLTGDTVLTLLSDRHVEVAASRLSPDGTLNIQTTVADFVRHLQIEGFSDKDPVHLLARIVINGQQTRSEPVPILLDSAPPEIHFESVPEQVEAGRDVQVQIRATTDDLSGISKIEAIFQSISTGNGKEEEWAEAAPDGNGGWVAILKTDKLGPIIRPTRKTILIRATDKAGNESMIEKADIDIVPKQEPSAASAPVAPPDVSNTVSGRAHYDNQAALVTVTLTSSTGATVASKNSNNAGEFMFVNIPPGEYVLAAKSAQAIRNKPRTAKVNVTVLPRDKGSVPITLSLE